MGRNEEMAVAASGREASRRLLVPVLLFQGLTVHALPWRKRPLPGGSLGIVVNIIDTPIGQLSLLPSEKELREAWDIQLKGISPCWKGRPSLLVQLIWEETSKTDMQDQPVARPAPCCHWRWQAGMLLKKTVIAPLHGLNVLGYATECSKFP